MEKNNSTKELLDLQIAYEQEKSNLSTKKDELKQKKKELYAQVIENIKSNIDTSPNSERLQRYLEKTNTIDLDFLYRSFTFMPGNNLKNNLSYPELILLDPDVRNIGLEHNITSEDELFNIFYKYVYHRIPHPFFENDKVMETMKKAQKLAYLDNIFKSIDNILDYQGAYTVYCYVKRYLKTVLQDEDPQTDKELVYKDYQQKLDLVLNNISDIAAYLLSIREQIPNSRLAICNQGLTRASKKLNGTFITFEQKVFANSIAFGTTLEKLKESNYEDAESLIFLPHQKILK